MDLKRLLIIDGKWQVLTEYDSKRDNAAMLVHQDVDVKFENWVVLICMKKYKSAESNYKVDDNGDLIKKY